MVTLTINNSTVDLYGNEKITASYKVAPLLDISSPTSSKTTEFNLPPTANNLTIFENCNVLTNSSTLPFDLIDARLYVNGVDTQIRYCKLYSYSEDIKCRLYGSETDFFSLIADKYLTDIDCEDLNFTWDSATIESLFTATDNVKFPVINYGTITTGSNYIPAQDCYPAMYMFSLLIRLVEQTGYTLDSDLTTDEDFIKELLPFAKKNKYYLAEDEVASAGFLVKQASTTITPGSEVKMNFINTISGQFGTFDYTNDEYTIPYDGYYSFSFKATLEASTSTDDIHFNLYSDISGIVESYLIESVSTSQEYFYDFTSAVFTAGEKVFIKVSNFDPSPGASDLDVSSGEFSLKELKRDVYFGGTWDVALNLPDMTQAVYIKQILERHGCIIYSDSINKIVYIRKIDNIRNTFPDDWSDKIDLSKQGEVIFDYGNYGQINHCTYQDDETVVKPTGTDYDILISNRSLEKEKDIFKSPFASCTATKTMISGYTIANIGVYELNNVKPRILISEQVTLAFGQGVALTEDGTTPSSSSLFDVDIPYFYNPTKSYDLTWTKIVSEKLSLFTDIIAAPKVVKCSVRLNESDLNQLDFTKPVYIDYYKVNFFKSEIIKDLTDNSSATVELIKL